MDDNFKHRLKNWVDKREAQNRMRMKDITHVVDPGRIIPKEDKEVEDHNYYSKKIREYIQKRLEQQAVNKSEELEKKIFSYEEILDIDNKYSPSGSLLYGKFAKYHKPGTQYKILNIPIKRLYTNEKLDEDDYQKEHKNYPGTEREFPHQKMWYEDPEDSDEFRAKDYLKKYPKGSTAQPIIVHPDSEGKYMILDGRHRARAAYLRGEKSIRAFVPINLPQAVNKSEELDKGAKGDWQKEGYTFKVIEHEDHPDFGEEALEIQAHHPKIGHVGGTLIRPGGWGEYEPVMTEISKDHQRKGLASEMYRLAENYLKSKLYPNEHQTKSAKKLWAQPNRPFGKSEELDKGSLQRKIPFNPKTDLKQDTKQSIYDWQENVKGRKEIPEMTGNARIRALNKLHSLTDVKRNPITGERMFLLHRGMGQAEKETLEEFGKEYGIEHTSSWTPDYKIASRYAKDINMKPVSAWIPESAIHQYLPIFGSVSSIKPGPNRWNVEHEVIVKPHKINITEYNRSFGKSKEFDILEKGAKELKAMYGSSITPEQENFVSWATSKLPNGNWQEWAVKNHAKNPQQFDQESIKNIEHFAGSKHIPNIAKVRFDQHDIKQGLEAFKTAEDEYNKKALANPQLIKPSEQTTKFMDVGDDYAWYMLNKPACEAEGAAMGHCGNVPSQQKGQNVLSLRKRVKVGDKEYHQPVTTFILQPDGKTIGEMKGRANLIPQPKYHKYIKQLLERSDLLPKGGGYLHGNNFHLDDLSHEDHDDLLAKRPELGLYSNRLNLEQQMQLAKDPKNHGKLARNPNLHAETQNILLQSQDSDVLYRLAENHNLSLKAQNKLSQSKDRYMLRLLAENPSLNSEAQNKLSQIQDDDVLRNLAQNPSLNSEVQNKFSQTQDKNILNELAQNPNLTPEAQGRLSQSQNENLLCLLARNPNLYSKAQNKLSQSQNEYVLRDLSANPNLTPEVQNELSQSQDSHVLYRLAQNPNLTPEVQNKLSQSQNENVLRDLSGNPNLTPEVQYELLQSLNKYVLRDFSSNPNLTPEVQNKLSQSHDEYVLYRLAQNRNLNPEAQNKLSQSQNGHVLDFLAQNTNLHLETQNILLQSQDEDVLQHLLENPKADPKIKKLAIKKLQEINPNHAEELDGDLKLEKLKLESENNLKAREARVKDYFERFK